MQMWLLKWLLKLYPLNQKWNFIRNYFNHGDGKGFDDAERDDKFMLIKNSELLANIL